MIGIPTATRPWPRWSPHLRPRRRARAVQRVAVRRGAISTPTAAGTTSPIRDTYGRLMTRPIPASIPTDAATGCLIPSTATCSCLAIHGAFYPTPAARGTSSAVSDGDGIRVTAAAIHGGLAAASIPGRGSDRSPQATDRHIGQLGLAGRITLGILYL